MQWYTHICGSTEPWKHSPKWWLWHYYTAIRRRLTFTRFFVFVFCCVFVFFVWKCIRIDTGVCGSADSGREDPDRERDELLAKTQRHVPLLRQGVKGRLFYFFLSFHSCWIFFFYPSLHFTTNSHISLAKNLEVEGSSHWCRACPGRTWRICNPVADLERVEQHHWRVSMIIRGEVGENMKSNMRDSIKVWLKLPMQMVCSDHQLRPGNVGHRMCLILDTIKKKPVAFRKKKIQLAFASPTRSKQCWEAKLNCFDE